MATKRQITLRFKDEYAKASKKDKGVILDRMCETLKIGRSTARRRLKEAGRAGEGREAPRERPKRYSDRSRLLLEQVWLLMDLPCAKYMKEMLPQWIPTLLEAGELRGFDTATVDELLAMSAATVFCQVVIGQCGVSFPSEKAVGFSPVRNWPVIARVLLFHCIRA